MQESGSRPWLLPLIALCACLGHLGQQANATGEQPGCQSSPALHFVCGAVRPEDLVHIPDTRWLIVSGFQDGEGLKLIDTRSGSLRRWYDGDGAQQRWDRKAYPRCPAPPDASLLNVQGIHLRALGAGRYRLYAANHGGRESIELFDLDVHDAGLAARWIGCVLLPPGVAANSVASFSDGTILITELTRVGTSIADFVEGKTTGAVYALAPGGTGFELLRGTELPGNNGLETARDDRQFYVVAFGWHAVVVYDRADTHKPRQIVTAPGFMPDNIHWDGDRLIAGGMQYDEPACGGLRKIIEGKADGMLCHRGYTIAQFDPSRAAFSTLAYAEPDPVFNGVSGAVIIGNELWLSSYQADRVAHRMLPWLPADGR